MDIKSIYSDVEKIVKFIFKRITCNHEYKRVCRLLGTNRVSRKEIELSLTYECVHCGKRIDIEMFDVSKNRED